MIELRQMDKAAIGKAQKIVTQFHYLHRPIDARTSVEGYDIFLNDYPIGLLMFGRPEATRCGDWYGSVDDVQSGRCEVTRWQVLNLSRVWLDPIVQPGGKLYRSDTLPGFTDRNGNWRSALARSEELPAGTSLKCHLTVLAPDVITESMLRDILDYGYHKGLGQWRGGGYGRFRYELCEEVQ